MQLLDHDEAVTGNNIGDDATVTGKDKNTMGKRSSCKRAAARPKSERRSDLAKRMWRVFHPRKDPTQHGIDDFATRFEAEEHAEMMRELIKFGSDVYGPDDWHQVFVSEIH